MGQAVRMMPGEGRKGGSGKQNRREVISTSWGNNVHITGANRVHANLERRPFSSEALTQVNHGLWVLGG